MKKSIATFLMTGAATLLLAACTNNKQPADQAITAADTALEAASEDAKRYIPKQYNDVLGKLNALKISYNNEKYDAVIAGAPAVNTAIKELADAAAVKKEEENQTFSVEWTTLSDTVPKIIVEVEHQGELLEKAKKKPDGINFVAARRYVAESQNMWKQAKAAGDAGRYESAVLNAKKAQQRAEGAARYLMVPVPVKVPKS
jgi:hypothetical protein